MSRQRIKLKIKKIPMKIPRGLTSRANLGHIPQSIPSGPSRESWNEAREIYKMWQQKNPSNYFIGLWMWFVAAIGTFLIFSLPFMCLYIGIILIFNINSAMIINGMNTINLGISIIVWLVILAEQNRQYEPLIEEKRKILYEER